MSLGQAEESHTQPQDLNDALRRKREEDKKRQAGPLRYLFGDLADQNQSARKLVERKVGRPGAEERTFAPV